MLAKKGEKIIKEPEENKAGREHWREGERGVRGGQQNSGVGQRGNRKNQRK